MCVITLLCCVPLEIILRLLVKAHTILKADEGKYSRICINLIQHMFYLLNFILYLNLTKAVLTQTKTTFIIKFMGKEIQMRNSALFI
jgi:hypothetical protein